MICIFSLLGSELLKGQNQGRSFLYLRCGLHTCLPTVHLRIAYFPSLCSARVISFSTQSYPTISYPTQSSVFPAKLIAFASDNFLSLQSIYAQHRDLSPSWAHTLPQIAL